MPIRVLVVDDSMTVRGVVIDALLADPAFEIVGEAADGATAVEKCGQLRPDVVTMDIRMPRMSGAAATQAIMADFPTPILVLSAATDRKEHITSYDALAAGAVDVMEKPREIDAPDSWAARLRSAVRVVSRVKVIGRVGGARVERVHSSGGARVVAIGASTGGPAAIMALLTALPADFPAPLLITVHLSVGFDESLADWLDRASPMRVRVAVDGQALPARGALLAPGERHLVLDGDRVRLDDGPERFSCRPSVDVLFESVANSAGSLAHGVLLTGMGRDGAAGLLAMRRAGARTWAQDEATSIVWGMPGEAVRLGAVNRIASPAEIAADLARSLQPARGAPWPTF